MRFNTPGGVNNNGSSKDRLGKSDVFHLLSNDRRRLVLCVLVEMGPCSKRELIDEVAAREYGVTDVPSDKRKRVLVSSHQCHLPKLEEYGVIEESQRDEYRLSVNADQVTPYLEVSSRFQKLKACL